MIKAIVVLGVLVTTFLSTIDLHRHALETFETMSSEEETGKPTIATTTPATPDVPTPLGSEELIRLKNIPPFMRDYFEWHGKQLQQLKEDAELSSGDDAYLGNYRFLVMRCASTKNGNETVEDRCGGFSDRMKAFPLFLWYAATSNRILFFRWDNSRPAPIETFLLPSSHWNWTMPEALARKIEQLDNETDDKRFTRLYFEGRNKPLKKMLSVLREMSVWMIEANDYTGGNMRYKSFVEAAMQKESDRFSEIVSKLRPDDALYENFYHDVFHATFRPSNGVETLLDSYFYDPKNDETSSPSRLRLPVPMKRNRYAVAHYRAQYPREPYLRSKKNQTVLKETAIHAVECTKSRAGSTTSSTGASAVYLMSDTGLALQAIHENYRSYNLKSLNSTNKIPVWTSLDLQTEDSPPNLTGTIVEDPQHLNFGNPDDHSGFYSTFVDLFLMSYANCVLHGAGGFGRGSL
eukprot:CAMPEP_0116081566 /NCGR_PEP_ID=MMETSP0327-20121206/2263_1 /TAXON_ID=44447 /ORGANISM="Pseudo-nitzschia delicatissima, Strain B596" /LENGTH=462 /DNA_ID=CAMNT_0003572305 /DNA_START=135 /DNA_END=1523 /DNA_ORIENTATION=+